MFSAVGTVPFLLSSAPLALWNSYAIEAEPMPEVPVVGVIALAGIISTIVSKMMMKSMDMDNSEILSGQCPCCDAAITQLFCGSKNADGCPPDSIDKKCANCGTVSTLNRVSKSITTADGVSMA